MKNIDLRCTKAKEETAGMSEHDATSVRWSKAAEQVSKDEVSYLGDIGLLFPGSKLGANYADSAKYEHMYKQ